MNETIVNELPKYYVTPYTFFTVFCFFCGVNHSFKKIVFKTFSSRKFAYIS